MAARELSPEEQRQLKSDVESLFSAARRSEIDDMRAALGVEPLQHGLHHLKVVACCLDPSIKPSRPAQTARAAQIYTALQNNPSPFVEAVGDYIRARSRSGVLRKLVTELLADKNFYRDLSLYNQGNTVTLEALLNHQRVACLLEWHNVPHEDRISNLKQALEKCALVRFDEGSQQAIRLSPPERVVKQVLYLLRRGPTDEALHDRQYAPHTFLLEDIVAHSSMALLCSPNVGEVERLLRDVADVKLQQHDQGLTIGLVNPPQEDRAISVEPLALTHDVIRPRLTWDAANGMGDFTLISYNVLALQFDRENWPVRRGRLISQITSASASIVCLQELQQCLADMTKNTLEDMKLELAGHGYATIAAPYYCPNPRAEILAVATFYRTETFELLESSFVSVSDRIYRRLLDQESRLHFGFGHAFALAHLRHRATGRSVLVANVHVIRRLENPEKMLAYMQAVLDVLMEKSDELGPDCPIVLCGDMNATAFDEVFKLIVDRAARLAPLGNICFPYRVLRHNIVFASAYQTPPECTTFRGAFGDFHNMFVGTIDHVFHTGGLRSVGTLVTPPLHALLATGATRLPNDEHPSDHLPVGAAFKFV